MSRGSTANLLAATDRAVVANKLVPLAVGNAAFFPGAGIVAGMHSTRRNQHEGDCRNDCKYKATGQGQNLHDHSPSTTAFTGAAASGCNPLLS